MNIATFSPALVLLYVFALLWILMGIRAQSLTRTQKWLVPLLVLALAILNHMLRFRLGSVVYGKTLFFTMHLPYFLLFLHLSKCGVIKMAFMILSAVVFMSPTIIVGNFVKRSLLFSTSARALFLANLLTYAIMLLLVYVVFRKGFNYLIQYGDNRTFLRLSIIPLLYYVYLFAVMNLDLTPLHSPQGFIVRTLPTFYIFLFYFLLPHNYRELNQRRELEISQAALRHQLDTATQQISFLNETQTQTAIYRHDLRHHLTAIQGFLSAGSPEQAESYIRQVQSDIEAITPKRFCENELVNLLCSSFSRKAEQADIQLRITAAIPKELSFPDTELCSLLSNGLENALHAVSQLDDSSKWIELYCSAKSGKLLIEIKNPYHGEIIMQDELPVSGRQSHGYGCRSIQTITERHQGLCAFEPKNGVFTLRVVLPVQPETKEPTLHV